MKNFATPHSHPASLDSASTVEAFANREVELDSGSLTCTDHGTLQAAHQVYEIAKKKKLIPIVGIEGYFRDDNCPILKRLGIPKTDPDIRPKGVDEDEWRSKHPDGSYYGYLKYNHLTLHAMDYKAYLCLVKLLSKADDRAERHGSERKPLFDWGDVEEIASHNVTAGSSCLVGMTQNHLTIQNNPDGARAYFEHLHHLFKDRFYVEVFPHVCTHNWVSKVFVELEDEQGVRTKQAYYTNKKLRTNLNEPKGVEAEELAAKFEHGGYTHLCEVMNYRRWEPLEKPLKIVGVQQVEDFLQNECTQHAPNGDVQRVGNIFVMGMAKKYGIKCLVSDDSHFASPEDKIVQDIRLAQGGGAWRFHKSYHRMSSDEAWSYFQANFPKTVDQKTFDEWIDNSHEWRDRFKDFRMDTTPSLPTKFFPADTLGHTKKLIQQHGRMRMTREYVDRLKQEIQILHRNGTIDLLPYFMIDEEVCRLYENQGMLTGAGRGSAAGLLLSYLLGITHIDPLEYGLSLDRFITLDRIKSGKHPDVDQDLSDRDILLGKVTDVVEVEMEDGTKHLLPEDLRIETEQGTMTVLEAVSSGADVKPWWVVEDKASTQE